MSREQRQRKRGRQSRAPKGLQRPVLTAEVPRVLPGAPLPTSPDGASAVDTLSALDFAAVARCLSVATQRSGLEPPLFRSPPECAGSMRSLRRNNDASVTVSVAVRGRFRLAVVADMIDGVVAANSLLAGDASALRDELWRVLAGEVALLSSGRSSAGEGGGPSLPGSSAGSALDDGLAAHQQRGPEPVAA